MTFSGYQLSASLLLFFYLAYAEDATLPTVVVTGKAEDLIGISLSSSSGYASSEDLLSRPVLRRGEILETIPGVIVTQHAGGGKANQYFLRGFNLDHGTDFATSIEGVPLSLRTHAHGQGYTDLNSLIPELLSGVDYMKGNHLAANGDLSTAGSADFTLFQQLPKNLATIEFGEDQYFRSLIAGSLTLGHDTIHPIASPADESSEANEFLTYALEYNRYDGPWQLPEDLERWNGLLRWFKGDDENYMSATFMGYHSTWQSSDQIPQRAVHNGGIDPLGHVDPTTGGESQRYSVNFAFQTRDGKIVTRGNVYGLYYDLDLFSNFTYFLDYPGQGDQFQQKEQRWVLGGQWARSWNQQSLFGMQADHTVGFQTRHDIIGPIGLYRTERRSRFDTVREDEVYEASFGVYADTTIHWSDWFRSNSGLRADLFHFDTQRSTLAANEGSEWDAILSPKLSLIFGPWAETEFYLNYGMGFHSNDARGVNSVVDPNSGASIRKTDPLVRTQSAEIGLRSNLIPNVTSTLSLFWIESDSELVYVGDAGLNEPGAGSRRYGIEFATYWRPTSWFTMDAELALTHARFTDSGNQDHIPSSIPLMFSGGLTLGAQSEDDGFFATFRVRAFERRPLIEDNSVQGGASFLVNAGVGYRHQNWEAAVECLNLFDRQDNDIEYYYASRLLGEPASGYEDIHFHPTEPRTFRVRLTYHF